MRYFIFILLSVLFYTTALHAQIDSLSLILDLSDGDDGLAEQVQELQLNPLNINKADASDLARIPYLSAADISHIMDYKERYGGFVKRDSLKQLLGTDVYGQIQHFITIGFQHRQGLSYIQKNYKQQGANNYAGGPWYNYSKIIYRKGYRWAGGIIVQKDPGERNFIDHLNGALRYRSRYFKLILGNFYLNFGQGLLFSNIYGTRKSILPAAVFRNRGITAHINLSSSENTGKYGVYAAYAPGLYFRFFTFLSDNLYDARLKNNDIRGLRIDGYHRTATEIAGANRLEERNVAAGMTTHWEKLSAGIILTRYRYLPGFNLKETGQERRKNYFSLHGDQLMAGSMIYAWQKGAYRFSGEAAFSRQGKPAFQQSLFYGTSLVNAGIRFWHINPGFQSPDGRMFDSADPFPSADQGYLAALRLHPFARWYFAAYKIFRQHLWRDYFNRLPVFKNEWLAELSYQESKTRLSIRYRRRDGDVFSRLNSHIINKQDNIRLDLSYHSTRRVWLRSRVEKTFFADSPESGLLFFQDLSYRFSKYIHLNGRVVFYKTSSYASRIYEFEKDLPGSFSNYPMYDDGRLFYLMMSGKLGKYLRYYIKWRRNERNEFDKSGRAFVISAHVIRSGFVLQF